MTGEKRKLASQKDIVAQIKALCERFSSEWRAGKKPRIETYLQSADQGSRARLLGSLLQIELRLLEQAGQTPSLETYQQRFPKHGKIVAAAYQSVTGKPAAEGQPTRDKADQTTSRRLAPEAPEGGREQSAPPDSAADDSLMPTGTYAGAMAQLESLGRFKVAGMLGQGGFGTVYRAYDPKLRRNVAIKIPRDDSLDPKEVDRLLQEARAAAAVSHPNVCPIYEVDEVGGRPYIVMAFVEGKPLSELLKSKPKMGPRQAATIIAKIAAAMAKAHEKGIVHRDLKPANVMIETSGRPVVMDFGLARQPRAEDAEQTKTGVVKGTPAYMSPEQARGEVSAFGPGMDIYSLGVMLYELLAGRRPFGGSVNEIIGKIQFVEPEPPSAHRKKLDPALEAICMKAMAKSIEDRYSSMRQLATTLKQYLRESKGAAAGRSTETSEDANVTKHLAAMVKAAMGESVAVRSVQRANRNVLWISLASIFVIGLVALAAIFMLGRPKTTMVVLNIDVDVTDESLEFVLDDEQIAGNTLQAPVPLTIGDHKLVVKRNGEIIRRYAFTVSGEETAPLVLKGETKQDKPKAPPLATAPFTPEQARQHQEAWAKYLDVPVEYENSLSMKFMLIPPGEFMMGSTEEEIDESLPPKPAKKFEGFFRSEAPRHRVRLTVPFFLAKTEVTVRQFKSFLTETSHQPADEGCLEGEDRWPIRKITWPESTGFLEWLSKREGLEYRLPTEAQWEFACRAGSQARWCFGNNEKQLIDFAHFYASGAQTRERTPIEVGTKRPNGFGLHDMYGNVSEFCQDWYAADYYEASAEVNPAGPTEGSLRVLRGGCYVVPIPLRLYSSHRWAVPGDEASAVRGFRAALSVESVQRKLKDRPPLAIAPFTAEQARQHQESWAKHLGVPVERTFDLPRGVELTFLLIPPGEFMMGSSPEEQERSLKEAEADTTKRPPDTNPDLIPPEGPQHRVRISRPFYLGKYEVTQAQWEAVMGNNPSQFKGPANPVERVSWNDIQPLLERLDGQCAIEGMRFELPTEAQWEYACRAGTTTARYCGDSEEGLREIAWFKANSGGRPQPVGQLQPNAWGLYNMQGNVREWVADRWGRDYFRVGPMVDPTGPSSGSNRVGRGGSWANAAWNCRSAVRNWGQPGAKRGFAGFRLALSFPSSQQAKTVNSEDPPRRPLPGIIPRPAKIPDIGRWQVESIANRGPTNAMALSPDGRLVACAQTTGVVRLYEAQSLRLVALLTGHEAEVGTLAWSPDSRQLAVGITGKEEKHIRIWSSDGTPGVRLRRKRKEDHDYRSPRIAWNPDSTSIAAGYWNGQIVLWKPDGTAGPTLEAHDGPVNCLAWSPDGQRLASGGPKGKIRLWSAVGEDSGSLEHSNTVEVLAWSPDGNLLASGNGTRGRRPTTVNVWNPQESTAQRVLGNDLIVPRSISWHPGGKLLAITGGMGRLSVCQLEEGNHWNHHSLKFRPTHDGVSVQWSPDGKWLLSCGQEGALRFSSPSGAALRTAPYLGRLHAVHWHPKGSKLASASLDGTVRFWDRSGRPGKVLKHEAGARAVQWSPAGTQIAAQLTDGVVRIYSETGAAGRELKGEDPISHHGHNRCVAWNRDDKWLAANDGYNIRLWQSDAPGSRLLEGHGRWVEVLSWNPLQDLLASGTENRTVRVWSTTSETSRIIGRHDSQIMAIDWAPDGQWLASSEITKRGEVRLWSLSGELKGALPTDDAAVYCLAWSPDQRQLASGDTDGNVVLWNPEDTSKTVLSGHTAAVESVDWSPDGRSLTSAGQGGTLIHWDRQTGQPLWVAVPLPDGSAVTFSGTGKPLHGEMTLLDKHFVYYIEQPDGSTKLYKPSEFLRRFVPDQSVFDVATTPAEPTAQPAGVPAVSPPVTKASETDPSVGAGRPSPSAPTTTLTPTEQPKQLPDALWKTLRPLLAERRYEDANRLLQQVLQDPKAEPVQEILAALHQDVERLQKLTDTATKRLTQLKPGDDLLVRGLTRKFVRFDGKTGQLITEVGSSKKTTLLADLLANDFVDLASAVPAATGAQASLTEAILLLVDRNGDSKKAVRLLEGLRQDGPDVQRWLLVADDWLR